MKTSAFPKILHIGDKQILDLFDDEVEITEKLDGSQFAFGKVDGQLITRSKGREITLETADKLFQPAVSYIKSIEDIIPNGYFFYGETLASPRHSTLAYDRTPTNHIALFGVYLTEAHTFLDYESIENWASIFGVDAVPLLFRGKMKQDKVLDLVKDTVSYLGGQKIEGVVAKTYKNWDYLGKINLSVMAGKYVTEEFKEVHTKDWGKLNTGKGKFDVLKENYRTEARWRKAIQHLEERGELLGSEKDIGGLIKEIRVDIEEEEKENIKDSLWKIYKDDILRYSVYGVAQWYKERLVNGEEGIGASEGEVQSSPTDSSSEQDTQDEEAQQATS